MVTPKPSFARSLAAPRPAQPAPTIATFLAGGPYNGGAGWRYFCPSTVTFSCVQSDRNFFT